MYMYLELGKRILKDGTSHNDRTGVGTRRLFGESLRFDLQDGERFPILTTRRAPWRSAVSEMLFFLSGSDDIRDLWDRGNTYWDQNYQAESWQTNPSFREYSLGRHYGLQMRQFNGRVDQMQRLVEGIRHTPDSRRHVVSLWNPEEIEQVCLPPCHLLFQVMVDKDRGVLDLMMTMRSCDYALGLPSNIVEYAALQLMLARVTGYKAQRLIVHLGDVHIYMNHLRGVREQFERTPYQPPSLKVMAREDLFSYTIDDFTLTDYRHHPQITFPLAV